MKEGGELGQAEGEAFGRGGADGDVAQFAAGARGLSVEMEVRVGDGEDFGGIGKVSDEIEHGTVAGGSRGAERDAEHGTEMILELAGDGALNRPVAGIVDAWGHFVGQEIALVFEEFDSEDAYVFQGFENSAGGAFRVTLDGGLKAWGRRER
jgi:hypothetical protein